VNFPDYMLFDLDPYIYSASEASGAEPEPSRQGFERGRQVAFWLKDVLDGMSLRSWVKTSGKTGLHVVVPIAPTLRYVVVRGIARTISEHLLGEHPAAITTQWDTRKRAGKVFMDFNMNVRGKSTIAPYGPRGLPGAPVSMPLTWRELARVQPMQFRIPTLSKGRKRSEPWSALLEEKQSLEAALSALASSRRLRSDRQAPPRRDQRTASGSSIFTSRTSRLSCVCRCTRMSSGLIETYFEITATSSRCSAGR
jgi:bifunctional non-homologous end joining protein LigD